MHEQDLDTTRPQPSFVSERKKPRAKAASVGSHGRIANCLGGDEVRLLRTGTRADIAWTWASGGASINFEDEQGNIPCTSELKAYAEDEEPIEWIRVRAK